ncbi:hypothetical protein GCM10017044_18110 [Kordiimonas sediminis]|uniref:Thioesterase family protein n=1 Tax=Kordiimonas sediminis TaxID=1735581 RepID=A0A919AT24_9PROT|nr:thioesterase family protein [Kordiimonas sediminis]GHF23919.1 hypothetical protein GCM10017044_18110 [Kordiimonas sediminis]
MSDWTFPDVIDTVKGQNGAYTAEVPDNWLQGRAAFGGLTGAIGVRALQLHSQETRPLRSLMVSFVGPMQSGTCEIHVRTLRTGKSVAQYCVEITQGDAFIAQISAVYGQGRDELRYRQPARDDLPPLDKYPSAPFVKGVMPNFIQYFENKWVGNGMPMSGKEDSTLNLWTRLRDDMSAYPLERMMAIADVPPPVVMSHYTSPLVASSLTWKIEILTQPQDFETQWFHLDYTLEDAQDGYSQQAGRIYDEAGNLIMLSHQCMCYFSGKSFS